MVICELLGVPYEDHEFFEEQSRRRFDADGQAIQKLIMYLHDLVQKKIDKPGDGLLDDLIAEQVVEFEEGRRIAWLPSEPGKEPPGHLWRCELEPVDEAHTRATHTYDWSRLTDEKRFARARAITAGRLRASLDRLAELAES